jgi:hypothetical protein
LAVAAITTAAQLPQRTTKFLGHTSTRSSSSPLRHNSKGFGLAARTTLAVLPMTAVSVVAVAVVATAMMGARTLRRRHGKPGGSKWTVVGLVVAVVVAAAAAVAAAVAAVAVVTVAAVPLTLTRYSSLTTTLQVMMWCSRRTPSCRLRLRLTVTLGWSGRGRTR